MNLTHYVTFPTPCISPPSTKLRAKREAELVVKGASASEAAARADKDLAAKEDSEQEEIASKHAAER